MKPRRLTLILTTLFGCAAASVSAAEKTAAAADKTPAAGKSASALDFDARVTQVQERIAALSKYRDEAPPPPNPAFNPFRAPVSGHTVAPPAAEGDRLPGGTELIASGPGPGDSLTLLQQGAATLKLGGTIEIGGRTQLVINARPRMEGDVVPTQVLGKTVYVRIKEIAKRSVTLSYEDAEMTLKFGSTELAPDSRRPR